MLGEKRRAAARCKSATPLRGERMADERDAAEEPLDEGTEVEGAR